MVKQQVSAMHSLIYLAKICITKDKCLPWTLLSVFLLSISSPSPHYAGQQLLLFEALAKARPRFLKQGCASPSHEPYLVCSFFQPIFAAQRFGASAHPPAGQSALMCQRQPPTPRALTEAEVGLLP